MKKRLFFEKGLAALIVLSLVLTACGGGSASTPVANNQPTTAPAGSGSPTSTTAKAATSVPPTTAPAGGSTSVPPTANGSETKVTAASGFVCPQPNPKLNVTSKELNLFVWTEYIPQDMLDCFEKVYNIKVNRDEYSSNEEMYAKISAGGTNYDLVQPTDYIVALMIRQNLLQKFDQTKLPALKNYNPTYCVWNIEFTRNTINSTSDTYKSSTCYLSTINILSHIRRVWTRLFTMRKR